MMSNRSSSFMGVGLPPAVGRRLSVTAFTIRPSLALASSHLTPWYLDDSKNTLRLLEWDQLDHLRGGIGEVRDRLSFFGKVRVLERALSNLVIRARVDGHHR